MYRVSIAPKEIVVSLPPPFLLKLFAAFPMYIYQSAVDLAHRKWAAWIGMVTPENNANDLPDIFELLTTRAEKRGDLPIFNASLNKVRRISSDPDAHAVELAQTVMKDVNLSVKLLRIANSPYYNRGLGKISSISRAVVLLGFETIKNLCLTLKMIESFQTEHPAIGMHQMVARAYLTAGFVRDVAGKCRVKEIEETYICGLTHNLGDISLAFFLPDKFNEIIALHKSSNISWAQAQETVLGTSLPKLGQHLATTWNFPSRVIGAMRPYNTATEGEIRTREQLIHAMASLSSQAIGTLYLPQSETGKPMRAIMGELAEATGVTSEHLENSLNESFQVSCQLAKEYGLDQTVLQPAIEESGDPMRDRFAREFAVTAMSLLSPPESKPGPKIDFLKNPTTGSRPKNQTDISTSLGNERDSAANNEVLGTEKVTKIASQTTTTTNGTVTLRGEQTENAPPAPTRGDPMVQLAVIQEITTLVTESATLNKLFIKILEGIHTGVGFDRTVLVLISPDRSNYLGRLAMGHDAEKLKLLLSGVMRESKDLFARVMVEGIDVLVENALEPSWTSVLKPNFVKDTSAASFIVAGIRSGHKPIGLFYADNATTGALISPDMRRGFLQFVAQARLAIQVRA